MRKEFEIAQGQGVATVPVGATGSMALELADELLGKAETLSPVLRKAVEVLRQSVTDLNNLLQPTLDAVKALSSE